MSVQLAGQNSETERTDHNDAVQTIFELMNKGEVDAAINTLLHYRAQTEVEMYNQVGRLTRSVHTAIRNFKIETSVGDVSDIQDATDRLDYVTKLTSEAAEKTLDYVEELMPIAASLKDDAEKLQTDWRKLKAREMQVTDFRHLSDNIETFLDKTTSQATELHTKLSEILLAQDFQDLTGQVMQKVTGMIREVETSLLNLVAVAANVEKVAGIHQQDEEIQKDDANKGFGPQIKASVDVVSNQDDVDDLLSSLGF